MGASGASGEDLPGGVGGEVFQPGSGVALGAAAAEQPGVGTSGGPGISGPVKVIDDVRQHGGQHRDREQGRQPGTAGTRWPSAMANPLPVTARTTIPSPEGHGA